MYLVHTYIPKGLILSAYLVQAHGVTVWKHTSGIHACAFIQTHPELQCSRVKMSHFNFVLFIVF